MNFIEELTPYIINFYYKSGRKFPWRDYRTPYSVYLSEILLQRTQARQVVPVFNLLIENYPDVFSLYNDFMVASNVMKSLGRFCRYEVCKHGLHYVIEKFNGNIPEDKDSLLSIPSIGTYIAAAIRIFGYGLHDTIIDTNVVRVLGRLYGLQITGEIRRKKYFIELAEKQSCCKDIVAYSYGILDFAFLICCSKKPLCDQCNFRLICKYYQKTIHSKKLN
ncbi:MAG: DNA glycosylase [Candidatus Eremiobacterota bacterium]